MNLYRHLTRAILRQKKNPSRFTSKTIAQEDELDKLQGSLRGMEKNKSEVERHIVETIISGLNQGLLKEYQLQEIATFVLERIDIVETQDQLIGFLHQLSLKWPIFEHLAIHEEASLKKDDDSKAAQNLLTLIKNDQISNTDNLSSSYINIK